MRRNNFADFEEGGIEIANNIHLHAGFWLFALSAGVENIAPPLRPPLHRRLSPEKYKPI